MCLTSELTGLTRSVGVVVRMSLNSPRNAGCGGQRMGKTVIFEHISRIWTYLCSIHIAQNIVDCGSWNEHRNELSLLALAIRQLHACSNPGTIIMIMLASRHIEHLGHELYPPLHPP